MADPGSVGSAFVELRYSLDRLPEDLAAAKQLIQEQMAQLGAAAGIGARGIAELAAAGRIAGQEMGDLGRNLRSVSDGFNGMAQAAQAAAEAARAAGSAGAGVGGGVSRGGGGGGGGGSAGAGGDEAAQNRVAIALERSDTRAQAFTATLQRLGAEVEGLNAYVLRADEAFAGYDAAVTASAGDTTQLALAATRLQRELTSIRGNLRDDAEAAQTAAAGQDRQTVALERSATQAQTFLRQVGALGADEGALAAATARGAAAFDAYAAAVQRSGGGVTEMAVAQQRLQRELAATREGLGTQVRASAGAEEGLGALDRLGIAAEVAGGKFGLLRSAFAGAMGGGAFVLVQGAISTLRELGETAVQDADAWQLAGQRIQATLKLTAEDARNTRDQLARSSQGAPLESTLRLATQIGPALQERGFGVENIEAITQTLTRLAAVSGTAPEQATRAFYQLSQAFALGKLQGQDLRILVEDMPPLFQALATATGHSQQELMELAHAGRLSSDMLAQGILAIAPEIAAQYASMGDSVGRGMTDVANAFEIAAGKAGESVGLVNSLGGALEALARLIQGPAVGAVLQELAREFGLIAQAVTAAANAVHAAEGTISRGVESARQGLGFGGLPDTGADIDKQIEKIRQARREQEIYNESRHAYGIEVPENDQDLGRFDRQVQALEARRMQLFALTGGRPVQRDEGGEIARTAQPEGDAAAGARQESPADKDLGTHLQAAMAAGNTVEALQRRIETAQLSINGLTKPTEDAYKDQATGLVDQLKYLDAITAYEDKRAGLSKVLTDSQRQLTEAQKQQRQQALEQQLGPEAGRRAFALEGQSQAGLDTPAQIRQRIGLLRAANQVPGTSDETVQNNLQTISQLQDQLHQKEQQRLQTARSHADTIENQRLSLIGSESPEAKLAADEEKIARFRRENPRQFSAADAQQATQGAAERYVKGVEQDVGRGLQGLPDRERIARTIDGIEERVSGHLEAQGAANERIVQLRAQLAAIDDRENERLQKQNDTIERGIETARQQLERVKARGGGGLQDDVEQARRAAEAQVELPSGADMDRPGGPELFDQRMRQRQDRGDIAERTVVAQAQVAVLDQIDTAQEKDARSLGRYNDLLARGAITQGQFNRATLGALPPMDQYQQAMALIAQQVDRINVRYAQGNLAIAERTRRLQEEQAAAGRTAASYRQQEIAQLYDRGEIGSGASPMEKFTAGLHGGALETIQEMGNASRQMGTLMKSAFDGAAESMTQWVTTGKGGLDQLGMSLEQMAVKMMIQIALAEALNAILAAMGLGGAVGGAAGAPAGLIPGMGGGAGAGYAPQSGGAGAGFELYARGGVVGGGVERMASGGILQSETLIPASAGRVVDAGEVPNDPEAVVPLKRTKSGTLGVEMSDTPLSHGSGTPSVVIHNHGEAVQQTSTRFDPGSNTLELTIHRITDNNLASGKHNRAIRQQFGIGSMVRK